MKKITLNENEKTALVKLKEALQAKFKLVDFYIFGSKVHGTSTLESDIDVMIEIEDYNPVVESDIDDLVFKINLEHDCFISTVLFGRKEIEDGPLGESPLYKVIAKEGVRM